MNNLDALIHIAKLIYLFLPAYVANASAVIFGGGKPLDGGRLFLDNNPLFGPNKTIKGFIAGIVVGSIVGSVQLHPLLGFLLSFGALMGDLAGSFIKRRFSLKPGAPFPPVDQLDFLWVSIIFSYPILPFPLSLWDFLIINIITFLLHISSNLFAYKLGLKKNPW
ncbi:hypothetical protein B6U74_03625 [Candidatus Bathyarchaeota archaeon ex4484_205]|nr:MAG: hypothetical protein B6U74_03625 [Candidatus Bathyarchaeota archaeon ex4484_205]